MDLASIMQAVGMANQMTQAKLAAQRADLGKQVETAIAAGSSPRDAATRIYGSAGVRLRPADLARYGTEPTDRYGYHAEQERIRQEGQNRRTRFQAGPRELASAAQLLKENQGSDMGLVAPLLEQSWRQMNPDADPQSIHDALAGFYGTVQKPPGVQSGEVRNAGNLAVEKERGVNARSLYELGMPHLKAGDAANFMRSGGYGSTAAFGLTNAAYGAPEGGPMEAPVMGPSDVSPILRERGRIADAAQSGLDQFREKSLAEEEKKSQRVEASHRYRTDAEFRMSVNSNASREAIAAAVALRQASLHLDNIDKWAKKTRPSEAAHMDALKAQEKQVRRDLQKAQAAGTFDKENQTFGSESALAGQLKEVLRRIDDMYKDWMADFAANPQGSGSGPAAAPYGGYRPVYPSPDAPFPSPAGAGGSPSGALPPGGFQGLGPRAPNVLGADPGGPSDGVPLYARPRVPDPHPFVVDGSAAQNRGRTTFTTSRAGPRVVYREKTTGPSRPAHRYGSGAYGAKQFGIKPP